MLEQIRDIICELVDIDPETINEDSTLRADLGLNSFDLVNMAVEIEKKFKKAVPNSEMNALKTVGDIIEYLNA